ncbi:BON domain-containing protein [Candidatus Blochmannia ocreatus (nom. nud.)]|uniref:BON domain-containing protein n=1 Tax=Candidatus Blochmannia ocreatus (nom. nud.) TaxID=251538 RepID=A0ABY4ST47_9ENTR|nr:BON domain-containing protein [Candidatus Blochmannia ocreatus]URJ25142.1 BON domain-containing protein [Candidatus Blochmannia ocreatus]
MNWLLLTTLLSIVTLQACCSSLLAVGTATAITTAWNDSRTLGTQLDDNIIAINITYSLYKNSHIRQAARIKNTVYHGDVLLTGQSLSSALTEDAIKIIREINGTKKIYNAIRKKSPINLQSILRDMWITNKIRFNIFLKDNIYSSDIKITTENKEVFLIGKITPEKENILREIIKQTAPTVSIIFIPYLHK